MSFLLIFITGAMTALSVSQDAELVDNPEYAGWKGKKVGAWVKHSVEADIAGVKIKSTRTLKLNAIARDKVVLEEVNVPEEKSKGESENFTRDVPARIKKGTNSEGDPTKELARGKETLTIGNKKIECEWVEVEVESEDGTVKMKTWRSSTVLGGEPRIVIKQEKGTKMTISMNATDWKDGE